MDWEKMANWIGGQHRILEKKIIDLEAALSEVENRIVSVPDTVFNDFE